MSVVDQAYVTQLKNIQSKTGKSLDELNAILRKSGLGKHGEDPALYTNGPHRLDDEANVNGLI